MRATGLRWLAAGTAAAMLAGCHVDANKNGDNKNVSISTPFGGLQVKTNEAADLENVGIKPYPGAQLLNKKSDDSSSADVNMHFGSFHLRVRAAGFHSDDPPEKVEAFYRDDLKRYGDVITCLGNRPVGTPTHTLAGLTCDEREGAHVSVDQHKTEHALELKTGSPYHQHFVYIEPQDGGTRLGLVALDLPGKSDSGAESDDTRQ